MTDQQPNLDVRHYSFSHRKGRGLHEVVKVRWDDGTRTRDVEMTVSPSGRSVHVYLDGQRMEVAP